MGKVVQLEEYRNNKPARRIEQPRAKWEIPLANSKTTEETPTKEPA